MKEFKKQLEERFYEDMVSLFGLTNVIQKSDATKKQKKKMQKRLKRVANVFGLQRRIIDDFEEQKFLGIMEFLPNETPTLIFTKWENILTIKEKVLSEIDSDNMAEAITESNIVFEEEKLKCFASKIYGRTVLFVDDDDVEPFLRILQKGKNEK